MSANVLVIYHAASRGIPCLDGKMAAVVFHHFMQQENNWTTRNIRLVFDQVEKPKIEYIEAVYDDPIPDLSGKMVFILDFSYDVKKLIEASKDSVQVILIDHHESMFKKWMKAREENPDIGLITSKEDDYSQVVFTTEKILARYVSSESGAVLTYKYMVGANMTPHSEIPYPRILAHCQDHDLYTRELDGTDEIVAAVCCGLESKSLETLSGLLTVPESYFEELKIQGKGILKYQSNLCEQIIRKGTTYVDVSFNHPEKGFFHKKIPICQAPRILRTKVGELLAKTQPFSIVYEDNYPEKIREFSLRSDNKRNDSEDVNIIAEAFGGGGHKHAAGFKIPFERCDHFMDACMQKHFDINEVLCLNK